MHRQGAPKPRIAGDQVLHATTAWRYQDQIHEDRFDAVDV
jgi:hypothetical protein